MLMVADDSVDALRMYMYSPLAGSTSILRLYCHTLCIFGYYCYLSC